MIPVRYLCCHLLGRWRFTFQPRWVRFAGTRLFFLFFVMFASAATADLIECEPKPEVPVLIIEGLSIEKESWASVGLESFVFRTSADKGVELDKTSPNFDENNYFIGLLNWQLSDNQYVAEGVLEILGQSVSMKGVLSETQFLFSASSDTENGKIIVVFEMACRDIGEAEH